MAHWFKEHSHVQNELYIAKHGVKKSFFILIKTIFNKGSQEYFGYTHEEVSQGQEEAQNEKGENKKTLVENVVNSDM